MTAPQSLREALIERIDTALDALCGQQPTPSILVGRGRRELAIAAADAALSAPEAPGDRRSALWDSLRQHLADFDRDNAHDIDCDSFNAGQDELIEVPTNLLRAALSAPGVTSAAKSPPTQAEIAMRDIADERQRQINGEGWSIEHDDTHTHGELANAAACYAMPRPLLNVVLEKIWPWDRKWWKPKDRRRDLVRAGALIVAEIERLDRSKS